MINLDDKKAILKIQGGDAVLKSVDSLPQQLRQSFEESQKIFFPEDYRNVQNIVVCGMGGSQWPSFIVKELFKEEITVPYVINNDYTLPGYVNDKTLVILSSYSGTTEESIYCGKSAQEKGAKLTGITTGSEVGEFLKKIGVPVYIFNPKYNPSNQPRIGFGYNVGGHLGLLLNLGFLHTDKQVIINGIAHMDKVIKNFLIDVPLSENPAKQLASKIYQKYPYYIVGEFLTGLGNGIGNQTNETAKSISSFRVIPELNHHLMEGLKFPSELHTITLFIFFYSKLYSPQIRKRFQITKDVVEQNKIGTLWYELFGENKFDQALELMALGSYMSMYLSALYEQDPSVIPYVDYFKEKLKEMK